MKFRVSFKTPDAAEPAINGALEDAALNDPEPLTEDKREGWRELLYAVANKYISYDECITIEFDSLTGTATVVQKGK